VSRSGIQPGRALRGVAGRPSRGSRRPRPSAVAVTDPCRRAALPRGTDLVPLTQASSQPGHQNPPSPAAPSPDPNTLCAPSAPGALTPSTSAPRVRPAALSATVLVRAGGKSSPGGCSGLGLLGPRVSSHQPTRVRCGRTPAPAPQHGAR